MIQSTLSFHMGTNYNLLHNDRQIAVNADSQYEAEHNWYDEDNITLEEAFEEFKDSFEEFNNRQRADRKFNGSYLEKLQSAEEHEKERIRELRLQGAPTSHIRQCKKAVKTSYEIVVGFGNVRDNPEFAKGGSMQDTAKQILIDYAEQLKKSSPSIKVFHVAIHTGESGNLHGHIDVVFVGNNCSRGMKKQASLNKAMAEMGYTGETVIKPDGTKIRVNPVTQWENDQREILKKLAKEKGIEIINGNSSRPHVDTELYKAEADARYVDELASELLQQQDDFIAFVASSGKAIEYAEHLENIELRKSVDRQKEMLAQSWKEFNSATSTYFDNYRQNKKLLYQELQRAKQSAYTNQKELNRLLNNLIYSNDYLIIKLLKLMFALLLIFQAVSLEYEVQQLYAANERLKQCSKEVMAESKTVSAELRNKDLDRIHLAMQEYDAHLNLSIQQINQIAYGKQIEER